MTNIIETVGTADIACSVLLGVMVIVTTCVVLLWLVWLARNWSFEAQMRMELAIMSLALVEMAVVAYLVLQWQHQLKLPTPATPSQQSYESTNHVAWSHQAESETGAPLPQIVPSFLRHQTTKKPREVPLAWTAQLAALALERQPLCVCSAFVF